MVVVREAVRTNREPGLRLVYGAIVFACLGVVLPLYAVPGFTFERSDLDYAAIPTLWAALRLSMLVGRGAPRLMAVAAWTFIYSFLTLPWLAQTASREYPLGTDLSYDDSTTAQTTLVIIVGILAFEIGHLLVGKQRATDDYASPLSESMFERLPNISVRASLVLAYLGFAFVALAVVRFGPASFFVSRDEFTQNFVGPAPIGVKFYLSENKAAGNALLLISQIPVFVGTYLLLYLQRAAKKIQNVRLISWWILLPLIAANVIVNNPISNPRSWWGTVLIGFLSIYFPFRERRAASRGFMLLYVAVSLFSFHQLAAFRRTGQQDFQAIPIRQSLISDPDYGSPQQIMNGVIYVASHGYRLGQQLEGTLLVWFPHKFWAGKPGDTGQLVGGSAGFKVAGPLWVEGLVDFGLIGVMLYLLLVGVLVARLDRRYLASPRSPNLTAALMPPMSSLLVFILRGSLQPAFGVILPFVFCVLLCVRGYRHTEPVHQAPLAERDVGSLRDGRQVASRRK